MLAFKRFVNHEQVPVGPTTEYTVPNVAGTQAHVKTIVICNTTALQVNGVVVKLGGTTVVNFPLAANDTKILDVNVTLEVNETITVSAGTANAVSIIVSGSLVTA